MDIDEDECGDNGDIQADRVGVSTEIIQKMIKADLHAFRQNITSHPSPDEDCDVLRWWHAN